MGNAYFDESDLKDEYFYQEQDSGCSGEYHYSELPDLIRAIGFADAINLGVGVLGQFFDVEELRQAGRTEYTPGKWLVILRTATEDSNND